MGFSFFCFALFCIFLGSRTAAQKDCWGKSSLEKELDLSEFSKSK